MTPCSRMRSSTAPTSSSSSFGGAVGSDGGRGLVWHAASAALVPATVRNNRRLSGDVMADLRGQPTQSLHVAHADSAFAFASASQLLARHLAGARGNGRLSSNAWKYQDTDEEVGRRSSSVGGAGGR